MKQVEPYVRPERLEETVLQLDQLHMYWSDELKNASRLDGWNAFWCCAGIAVFFGQFCRWGGNNFRFSSNWDWVVVGLSVMTIIVFLRKTMRSTAYLMEVQARFDEYDELLKIAKQPWNYYRNRHRH